MSRSGNLPHLLSKLGATSDPGLDTPDVGRMQPLPTGIIFLSVGGYTVITRTWSPGDAARCRLCPRNECVTTQGGNACTVAIPGAVPEAELALCPLKRGGAKP